MFIKLTEVDIKETVYVTISKIGYLYFDQDSEYTKIELDNDSRLFVKETPEEIFQLINRAKFSDLLDQEITKPIKKRTKK